MIHGVEHHRLRDGGAAQRLHRIEQRGKVCPQRKYDAVNMFYVAEEHEQRAQEIGYPQRKYGDCGQDYYHEHYLPGEHEVRPAEYGQRAEPRHQQQRYERKSEGHQRGEYVCGGEYLYGHARLLQHVALPYEAAERGGGRTAHYAEDDVARKDEYGVVQPVGVPAEDRRKDERHHDHVEQRVEHSPQHAYHRAVVLIFYVAPHQQLQQIHPLPQISSMFCHLRFLRYTSSSPRLRSFLRL